MKYAINTRNVRTLLLIGLTVITVSGCAAAHTAIAKRNLDVQTRMSSSVFLDPVAASKRTVYLQVRNSSDKPEFQIEEALRTTLQGKQYAVVTDPDQANYMLQVNILQVGKMDPTTADHIFSQGFGGAVAGAALLASGGRTGPRGIVSGGLIGGTAGLVAGALVKDVTYTVITDVQVSERPRGNKKVNVSAKHKLQQGSSGAAETTVNEESDWMRYQTRVMSQANKVNLDFEEALPKLAQGLSTSISGLF